MSINLTVYVGPYFKCQNVPNEVIEKHAAIVTDGRGESDFHGFRYLVPNSPFKGLERELRFERHGCDDVTPISGVDHEKNAFVDAAIKFLVDVEKSGGTATIQWGVVPGLF